MRGRKPVVCVGQYALNLLVRFFNQTLEVANHPCEAFLKTKTVSNLPYI